MITDLSLASDLQKDFRDYCDGLTEGRNSMGGIDFNVTVLTTGFWPSYQVQDANLCPEMQKAIQVFHVFYNGRTQHRRLKWIHSLGQATIAMKLNSRKHDLIVNSYQALIMLLYSAKLAGHAVPVMYPGPSCCGNPVGFNADVNPMGHAK